MGSLPRLGKLLLLLPLLAKLLNLALWELGAICCLCRHTVVVECRIEIGRIPKHVAGVQRPLRFLLFLLLGLKLLAFESLGVDRTGRVVGAFLKADDAVKGGRLAL